MSLRVAQAIVTKDLRAEARSRSAVSTVLPFAATMLLAFGFALGPDPLLLARTAPALLWLAALPVLVVPLGSAVVIAATKATADLTRGTTAGIGGWLGLLAAFDAAYLAAGYLVFGHLLED